MEVRRAQHEDRACRPIMRSTAEIDLGPEGGARFSLAARLYVSLPGMEARDRPAQRPYRRNPPGVSLFASNAREHRR